MSFSQKTVLKRLILGFGDDGSFSGGHADWQTLFTDDTTGEVVRGPELAGQPIAGAMQPNEVKTLAQVLSDTELQRIIALDNLQSEHQVAVSSLIALQEEHQRLNENKIVLEEAHGSLMVERDEVKAERDKLKISRNLQK